MSDDTGVIAKLVLTVGVIVAAIPGLVVEPGPLSEIAALAALGAIWGVDLGIGGEE